MSFDSIPEAAPDPVFGKLGVFHADPRKEKINLMVGIYKDEYLRNQMLPSVLVAKERVSPFDQAADYLPFDGPPDFVEFLGGIVFGDKGWSDHKARIYGALSLGGTGALCLGATLIGQEIGKRAAIPQPTWANHRGVLERAGFAVEDLPYYSSKSHGFDLKHYLQALNKLAPKTLVVLHGACHNPTGCDPTLDEWKEIARVMKDRLLIPFFDFAYQGLGDGIEEDASAIRLFAEEGMEMLVAYSCSKNFSLYCQRVGALFAVAANEKNKRHVGSQVRRIIRTIYSNPPAHGAKTVIEIMKDPLLTQQWRKEVDQMRRRLTHARSTFLDELIAQSKGVDFRFAKHHKGMFSYLDLTAGQVERLIEKHAIYTLTSGRINVAGLTAANISRVVEAIVEVCNH